MMDTQQMIVWRLSGLIFRLVKRSAGADDLLVVLVPYDPLALMALKNFNWNLLVHCWLSAETV